MKKILACIMALVVLPMTVLFTGFAGSTAAAKAAKPATWIADRHIVAKSFIDDQGTTLPDDQMNNLVAKKIKELTGITIEWQYTSGTSDLDVMTTAMASGDLPDLVTFYLDNSSRPEFPVLLKAAREGLFTNVAPLLKNTKIYSKYLQPGYLPTDTKNNIMFRPEFKGAAYLVQMNIERTTGSNSYPYKGGMYIQKSIADKLKIDPRTIKTEDQLYALLKKIKAGHFKDANGKEVYPLGPSYWGNNICSEVVTNNFNFGVSNGFNITKDGKVLHEAETDYVYKQIEFYQKLLKEKLINPEFFTMDMTRAKEVSLNNNSAIIGNIHNYEDFFRNANYLPIGKLNNYNGNDYDYSTSKAGYCGWAIPSTTKNPEEIVKFLDFLASKQGKLLWQYGVEGVSYDMVKGKPVVKPEYLTIMKGDDRKAKNNTGIWMSGSGSNWLDFIGGTDMASKADFGELNYGENADPHQFDYATKLYNYNPPKKKYVDGFKALGYLPDLKDIEPKLKPVVDELNYKDIRVKAIFSGSMTEAKKIIENYRKQLKDAGVQQFEQYLEKKYKENPKSVYFY